MSEYEFVGDCAHVEQMRFVVTIGGYVHADYPDFRDAVARAAFFNKDVRIVKEHCFRGEWLPVAHYIFADRGTKLEKLQEQQASLAAEIAALQQEMKQ